MSIRNPRTNRHEDDLIAAAYQNNGEVTVLELVEHLEEVVVGAGFGENVELPVAAAAALIRQLLPDHEDLHELVVVDPRRNSA